MSTHNLKTLPEFFSPVSTGAKTFEIRSDDRGGYRVGDTLRLQEWDGAQYTGREVLASVTFVTDFAQQPGYVVMGIRCFTCEHDWKVYDAEHYPLTAQCQNCGRFTDDIDPSTYRVRSDGRSATKEQP